MRSGHNLTIRYYFDHIKGGELGVPRPLCVGTGCAMCRRCMKGIMPMEHSWRKKLTFERHACTMIAYSLRSTHRWLGGNLENFLKELTERERVPAGGVRPSHFPRSCVYKGIGGFYADNKMQVLRQELCISK